jgi:hypothetical protein
VAVSSAASGGVAEQGADETCLGTDELADDLRVEFVHGPRRLSESGEQGRLVGQPEVVR